ncbi:proteasome-type protease [Caldimonas thermodepolymerans]|uniref:Peptidase n=1 Tax=Caldimonas thermodepolymerans TaxID=215580 RepID=A0A2S5T2N6_9BURK|nr:proteasome-type protease [Caldimonas thermodepolymerans]PPE69216.1 peptidase [Caldimonas thermodepolymerans]QPC32879.1 proteasome-type protease [Caldimonas thermodepolymerans]RDI03656.1 putative proteasome-type protease [Caldimonas thermodepolymerans]UZG45748.1 proteasome-type protease [Caldimonas thermodepolymerans]
MTYCVAMRLDAGMVFLSDSRTNAGLDQISTFRKMSVYEQPGDRVMVLLSAGNLAITQAVRQLLRTETIDGDDGSVSIWNCRSMHDAARIVGACVRKVHERDAAALRNFGIEFNVNLIFGGQIRGEPMRLFNVYAAGNFVEAGVDGVCYFQIGESKYGKPIIDRIVTPATPLDQAVKCALVSMDSTLRSNLSVGLPLDLLVYEADTLHAQRIVHIDERDPYFRQIRDSWGQRLREAFVSLPNPTWDAGAAEPTLHAAAPQQQESLNPLRKIHAPDG